MAQATAYQQIDLSAYSAGGPIQLPLSGQYNFFNLYNNVTLVKNLTITDDGTPVGGELFIIQLSGTITTGASNVSIFGQNVNGAYLQANMVAFAFFDGSAYQVCIMPSFLANAIILGANIKDNTVSLGKLVTGTSGHLVMYNGSGAATATAMSGDITISSSGVTAIGAAKVLASMIASGAVETAKIADEAVTMAKLETSLQNYFAQANVLISYSVEIPSADIKTANSTPIVLVSGVVGKDIIPVSPPCEYMDYGTTPYATNGITQVRHDGASIALYQATANGFLFGTVTRKVYMTQVSPSGVTDTQIITGADLLWTISGGDPINGDSDIIVSGLYQLV